MDPLDLFLAQHAHSHAAALTGADEPYFSDQVIADLTEAQLRRRPAEGLNSIAWLLWHLARCDDVAVRVLLTGHGQVLDEGDWPARLNLTQRDMGTGMDAAGVAAISAAVNIPALLAYRLAVGRRTRAIAPGLRTIDWDTPCDPTRLLAVGAFPNPADGAHRVATYWQGKTHRYVLTSALATHNYQHLGEATCIKSLLRAAE